MKNISRKILSFVLACAMIVPMFIMPLQAETTIQSVTSPAGYENIEIRVTTDKEPLSYRVGDIVLIGKLTCPINVKSCHDIQTCVEQTTSQAANSTK